MTEVCHHALLSAVLWLPSDTIIHPHGHAISWWRPALGFKDRRCCEAPTQQKTPGVRTGAAQEKRKWTSHPEEVKAGPGTEQI